MKNREEQKEPQSISQDEDIAPLSSDFFNDNDRYLDIDIGVFDYVFKCLSGPYAGKFFYVNTSPSGEIIGGAKDYNMNRNPDKLTMYIENCELSQKHVIITLNSHCQYQIQDASPDNVAGVWIKIPTNGEGLDLYRNKNYQRKYMINDCKYIFEFNEDESILLDLFHWLRISDLQYGYDLLQRDGITNFGALFSRLKDFLDQNNLNKEYAQRLLLNTQDLKNTLQYLCGNGIIKNSDLLFQKKNLVCNFIRGADIQFQLDGYQGYLVGGPSNSNANITIKDDQLNDMFLYIIFKHGSYFVVGDHSESNPQEVWVSSNPYFNLFKQEKYTIHPGYIIKMGPLSTFQVERFNTGVIADQGSRGTMEDTYLISQDIGIDEFLKASLYVVIDGHGGEECAMFIRQRLEQEIRKELTDPDSGLKSKGRQGVNECVTFALKRAFINVDEQFHTEKPIIANKQGATAVCVLIIGNRVFCANVGDSRAVLCRNAKAINLSFDHKTGRKDEEERVKAHGGIINCGRLMDTLAITRAFGDFKFKMTHHGDHVERKDYLTAEPEVRLMDIDPFIDDFIVMGSDGLFDKFSSQDVVNYIRTKLAIMPYMEQDVTRVAKEITNECIHAKHVRDNVTTIIIALNRGIKQN